MTNEPPSSRNSEKSDAAAGDKKYFLIMDSHEDVTAAIRLKHGVIKRLKDNAKIHGMDLDAAIDTLLSG